MLQRFLLWLLSLVSKDEPKTEEQFDLYMPEEKMIYSYWDGSKLVTADPMVVYRRLMEKGPELNVDMMVATSPSKDADNAHVLMLEKIRYIFDVKPLENNNGLTEEHTIGLLNHFLTYTETLKKNLNPSPISSPVVEEEVSKELPEEIPPIENISVSGSTEKEPSTDMQEPSPSVLQSL